jgi:hypothetical protein
MNDDSQLLVGIDLDYTLLDVDRFFYDNVLPALCEAYPEVVEREAFISSMNDFRQNFGPANEYDFFGQITSMGLDADAVEAHIEAAVTGHDFLRPGAADFVALQLQNQHDVRIITIGVDRYQLFKKRCIPLLNGVPVHVIREAKGAFIAKEFDGRHGYMVDDKLLVDLPKTIKPIYIRSRKSENLPDDAFDGFSELLATGPAELIN